MIRLAHFFKNKTKKMHQTARVAIVQWEQKRFPTVEDFLEKLASVLDEILVEKADIALFPEHLSWSIATACAFKEPADALRHLADFSAEIADFAQNISKKTGLRIILGSLPVAENGQLLNRAYFLQPDREPVFYDKTHLTPWEKKAGFSAGDELKIWETPFGKIAPLICYDIEFPEAARMLAVAGARAIFVPFQTDSEAGFWRIRHCSQARAIENECFIVTAGNVGFDPQSPVMDENWASSAILTPSDIFFKKKGILCEIEPNQPSFWVETLDFKLLEKLHRFGTVRTMADRRADLTI